MTFAPVFPVPVLPPAAFRRSWLADMLVNRAASENFFALLKRLNPAKARRVGPGRPLAVFEACLSALPFPTESDYLYEQIECGETSLQDVWHWGIPIDVQGFHPDHGSDALLVAACTCRDDLTPGEAYTLDNDLMAWVKTWWRPAGAIPDAKPPRGRDFIPPWNGLPDLQRYVRQTVGNDWLDLNFEDVDGSINPPWSAPEIRSLARMWKQAEPVEARIHVLADHIDEAPRERLPLMDKALRGDGEALFRISRARPQPLWKSFSRTHR